MNDNVMRDIFRQFGSIRHTLNAVFDKSKCYVEVELDENFKLRIVIVSKGGSPRLYCPWRGIQHGRPKPRPRRAHARNFAGNAAPTHRRGS